MEVMEIFAIWLKKRIHTAQENISEKDCTRTFSNCDKVVQIRGSFSDDGSIGSFWQVSDGLRLCCQRIHKKYGCGLCIKCYGMLAMKLIISCSSTDAWSFIWSVFMQYFNNMFILLSLGKEIEMSWFSDTFKPFFRKVLSGAKLHG